MTTIRNHIDIAATPHQVWDVLADLDPLDAATSGTRVSQVMRYDTRFGLLGAALNKVMIQRKTDQGIKGFLAGLGTTVTHAHPSTPT